MEITVENDRASCIDRKTRKSSTLSEFRVSGCPGCGYVLGAAGHFRGGKPVYPGRELGVCFDGVPPVCPFSLPPMIENSQFAYDFSALAPAGVQFTEDRDIDLIVMGTQGTRGVSRG